VFRAALRQSGSSPHARITQLETVPQTGSWLRAAVVVACVSLVCATSVAAAEDTPVVPVATPVPAARCSDDPLSPRREVEAAFAELQKIHRIRVAGPAGEKLLALRVNALLDRLIAFDLFVDIALGDAWDQALPEQRESWRTTLSETLRSRYLRKLGSPLAAGFDIKGVVMRCDRAEVAVHIVDRKGRHPQDVLIQLVVAPIPALLADGMSPDQKPVAGPLASITWHAFDVTVDGVSLLETWKSRFRRIYADGGLAAIEQHMRGLRDRYGAHTD